MPVHVPVSIGVVVDASVTANVAVPETVLNVALMMVIPEAAAVANPAAEITALSIFEELQVTEFVISRDVLSEYIPIALNCCVAPTVMLGLPGVTTIKSRVAVGGETVIFVVPETPSDVAMISELPAASAVARPSAEIVTSSVIDEVQTTEPVISFVVLSEYVPVALNCCVAPTVMFGLPGVTVIDNSIGSCRQTVTVVLPDVLPHVALIVEVPAASAVKKPVVEMVAVSVFEELQVTEFVISRAVLSEYVPVAMNCCVVPAKILGAAGVSIIEVSITSSPGVSSLWFVSVF